MADLKITDLPVATVMSSDDLLHKVDDPSGSPTNQKIAWSNLITQIETDISKATLEADITQNAADIAANAADIATAEADILTNAGDIATNAAAIAANAASIGNLQYGQLYIHDGVGSNVASNGAYTKLTQWTNVGISSANVTPDVANDKITISETGIYIVSWQLSLQSSNNVIWEITIFLGGVHQDWCEAQRFVGTGTDTGSMAAMGILDITSVPADIDLRVEPDGASKTISILQGQLVVHRIGDT